MNICNNNNNIKAESTFNEDDFNTTSSLENPFKKCKLKFKV